MVVAWRFPGAARCWARSDSVHRFQIDGRTHRGYGKRQPIVTHTKHVHQIPASPGGELQEVDQKRDGLSCDLNCSACPSQCSPSSGTPSLAPSPHRARCAAPSFITYPSAFFPLTLNGFPEPYSCPATAMFTLYTTQISALTEFEATGLSLWEWLVQGTRQVTRAAVDFYGPDRAKFLGPFSIDTPSYLVRPLCQVLHCRHCH